MGSLSFWSWKGQVTLYIADLLFSWMEMVLQQSLRRSAGFSILVIWWCWHFGSHSVAFLRCAFCPLPALKAQNTFLLQGLYITELSSLKLVNITMLIWLRNVALILRQFLFPEGGNECSKKLLEERGSCLGLLETEDIFTLPLWAWPKDQHPFIQIVWTSELRSTWN